MPFQKKVQCLRDITNKVISIRIASFCVSTEMVVADDGSLGSLKSEKALSRMLLDLPGVLVDTLIYTAIKTLLEDEDRSQGLQEVDGTGPMSHVPCPRPPRCPQTPAAGNQLSPGPRPGVHKGDIMPACHIFLAALN